MLRFNIAKPQSSPLVVSRPNSQNYNESKELYRFQRLRTGLPEAVPIRPGTFRCGQRLLKGAGGELNGEALSWTCASNFSPNKLCGTPRNAAGWRASRGENAEPLLPNGPQDRSVGWRRPRLHRGTCCKAPSSTRSSPTPFRTFRAQASVIAANSSS